MTITQNNCGICYTCSSIEEAIAAAEREGQTPVKTLCTLTFYDSKKYGRAVGKWTCPGIGYDSITEYEDGTAVLFASH